MAIAAPDEDDGGSPLFADINLTPLTDVFLVMLVIFMVSALAVQAECEKKRPPPPVRSAIQLPQSGQNDVDPAQPAVVLEIARDGAVSIAGKPLDDAALAALLAAAHVRDARTQLVIRADRDTHHGRVVQVIDRARRAGISHVAVATDAAN